MGGVGGMDSVESLRAELAAAKELLGHPAVKAVVELVKQWDWEYRRAEAAHDAKDEANRRWLEAVKKEAGDE